MGHLIKFNSIKFNSLGLLINVNILFLSITSGAACVILGNNPTMTPAELKQELIDDATLDRIINVGNGSPNRLLYIGTGPLQFRPRISVII